MRNIFKLGGRLTAVLAMTAVAVLALAGPASAAGPQNSAFGISAAGIIDIAPTPFASSPDGPLMPDPVIDFDIGTIVTTDTLNAQADGTSATASVEGLTVILAPATALPATTLTADVVSSECSSNGTTVTGSVTLTNAFLNLLGVPSELTVVAPETSISIPGVATILINHQTVDPVTGALTVDAIVIELLGLNGAVTQTITIASVTCQVADVGIPVIAPPFAVGAGVLGLLGLGVFLYRRRETTPGIAQA